MKAVFKVSAIVLAFSGVMDLAVYLLYNYHAPAWVLGVTWLSLSALMAALAATGVAEEGEDEGA